MQHFQAGGEWAGSVVTKCYLTMWRMCHGFCWAAHLDAALCVCRSLRNKLARVGNRSVLQQKSVTRKGSAE